jgi:hypothetical protein
MLGTAMSDSYELLIDHEARPENASSIGKAIVDALIAERIILPDANPHCVLTGVGYPPGPRVREIYNYRERDFGYWDMLTIGVKLYTDHYVNSIPDLLNKLTGRQLVHSWGRI